MGKFNSDDHYIYYCGQKSLRRNGIAILVNKSPKCSTWMQSQKGQNDLCSVPRQPFNITVIEVYAPTTNAKEAKVEWFYSHSPPIQGRPARQALLRPGLVAGLCRRSLSPASPHPRPMAQTQPRSQSTSGPPVAPDGGFCVLE